MWQRGEALTEEYFESMRLLDSFTANFKDDVEQGRSPALQQLYLPGNILYFVRERSIGKVRRCGCLTQTRHSYSVVWASQADFADVLVSSRMLVDHFPDTVLAVLQRTHQRFEAAHQPASV